MIQDQGDVALIIEAADLDNPSSFAVAAYLQMDSSRCYDMASVFMAAAAIPDSVYHHFDTFNFSYISLSLTQPSVTNTSTRSVTVTHTDTELLTIPTDSSLYIADTTIADDYTPEQVSTLAATKKKYKPVALKVRPQLAALPEKFRIRRNIVGDPLEGMPPLNPCPPPFVPTGRYTLERKAVIDNAHPGDFLWPAERELMHHFMCLQNQGFAWDSAERGRFREDFFPPVDMPVVDHKPWVLRNHPIPPGIYDQVCKVIKAKIEAGVYERSNSSYRSQWFCVVKKDGSSLRLVHSLEPLNAVMIQHSGVPPHTEQIAEHFAGLSCGAMLDLYVGYDERLLAVALRHPVACRTRMIHPS